MKQFRRMLFLGAVSCCAAAVLSLCLGASGLTSGALLAGIFHPQSLPGRILWLTRLPRTLGCLLAGAALSLAGCVIQNVLHNPLASPNIIGVNAGAGLAVTACCAMGCYSGWVIAGAAFLGALSAVALVALWARSDASPTGTVILAGVAVNALLNGLRDALTTLDPQAGAISAEFRVGGFSSVGYGRLLPAMVLILLAMGLLFRRAGALDVLSLGQELATGLGLNVPAARAGFLTLAALLSGAAVSYAGLLGFVGLIVPHTLRRIFPGIPSPQLLPLAALFGGSFVTLCDTAARVAFAPYDLPVGIFLAVLGGPFFLYLLRSRTARAL